MNPSPPRRAVLLSTDCGTEIDDQWALVHLALSPELDLRGVVTTHAPNLAAPAAETSSAVVRQVLEHLPAAYRAPVYPGSSVPLADRVTPAASAGVEYLLDVARGYSPENPLTVLLIGAVTDIASALLIDPGLKDRIRVVAMGFQGLEAGGDEWNVKNDVRAWQVLLEAGVETVVGDAAVCKRHLLMTGDEAIERFSDCGATGRYLASMLVDWLRKEPDLAMAVCGRRDTWPMWDQVTVAHLLGLTTCRSLPRLALKDDLTFAPADVSHGLCGGLHWITSVNENALWEDLARKLHALEV